MSQAAIAGLEEPEAHLSFDAQKRIAEALRALVADPAHPPFQLFVSSHSYLMTDLSGDKTIYFETTLVDDETRIERHCDPERLAARFPSLVLSDDPERRLLGANLVRLSAEAVRHLKARTGDKLFEVFSEDGSLALMTLEGMDAYLTPRVKDNTDRDATE